MTRDVVSPEERDEVLAREVPGDLRLAARMAGGRTYRDFHRYEQLWAYMHEMGLVDAQLYALALDDRFGFKTDFPALSAGDFIKAVSESRNPAPLLAMVSQAVGAKRIGDQVVPIRRDQVPGMGPELEELIQEHLVRQDLDFAGGMELMEILACKKAEAGELEDEQLAEVIRAAKAWKKAVRSLERRT